MPISRNLLFIAAAALIVFSTPLSADFVYVVNGNNQFGTVDLGTGAFQQIGPNMPEAGTGLTPRPNGSLLTLAYSGNLDSINPVNGVTTVIGPTGLSDCTMPPASPCGPNSANALAGLGGTIYATDFANNLYTVNPVTGAARLIGPTGIPALPFTPYTTNPDGSFNVFEETLFGAGGKLYATFDTNTLDPVSGHTTPILPNHLYQIDPSTGMATQIAPTAQGITAVFAENGAFYAFDIVTQQVLSLDLANGRTSFISDVDPAVGYVGGASPVPEPGSLLLAACGGAGLIVYRRRRLVG